MLKNQRIDSAFLLNNVVKFKNMTFDKILKITSNNNNFDP